MPNESAAPSQEKRNLGQVVEHTRTQLEDAKDRAKDAVETSDRRLTMGVQENPMMVLGVAVGVGYVVGRIFAKVR